VANTHPIGPEALEIGRIIVVHSEMTGLANPPISIEQDLDLGIEGLYTISRENSLRNYFSFLLQSSPVTMYIAVIATSNIRGLLETGEDQVGP